MDNVKESDNVVVAELFEERDLTNGCGGDTFVFCFKTDLFQGNDAAVGARCQVFGFVYDTICTCVCGIGCESVSVFSLEKAGKDCSSGSLCIIGWLAGFH